MNKQEKIKEEMQAIEDQLKQQQLIRNQLKQQQQQQQPVKEEPKQDKFIYITDPEKLIVDTPIPEINTQTMQIKQNITEEYKASTTDEKAQIEEQILDDTLIPPKLDMDVLMYSTPDIVRATHEKYAQDMQAYAEKTVMNKMAPLIVEEQLKLKQQQEKVTERLRELAKPVEKKKNNNTVPWVICLILALAIFRFVSILNETDDDLGELSWYERNVALVTPAGEKYHKSSCQYVQNKKLSVYSTNAAKSMYDPCSVCYP